MKSINESFQKLKEIESKMREKHSSDNHTDDSSLFSDQIHIVHSPKETAIKKISHKIQDQNKLVIKQNAILNQQNNLLYDNYNKLKDLVNTQEKAYSEKQKELKRSQNFNRWMMFIAIIAMLAAISSPIVTILV